MTKQELNKRIMLLSRNVHNMDETDAREEFLYLYHSNNSMDMMTANSIRMMLRMNLKYRFVALHQFGLFIELPK